MKLILLAAAAVIATPVIAQTTPAPTDSSTQSAPADAAAPADPAAPAPAAGDPMAAQPAAAPAPGQPLGTETAGGYQPAQPALSGPVQPGATVRFQQAPTPEQAYPAPAPLKSYPICKKGQYNQCRQRGGK